MKKVVRQIKLITLHRQGGKDQTKKGPNIKLGPQGDKKDPRKDSTLDSGHHLKVPQIKYDSASLICAFGQLK